MPTNKSLRSTTEPLPGCAGAGAITTRLVAGTNIVITSRFSERAVARSYGQALSGPAARETGIRLYMLGNLPCSKGQRTVFALMCALRRCVSE